MTRLAHYRALACLLLRVAAPLPFATLAAWPDLVVGIGIFIVNLDAAREVFVAARRENLSIEV